VQGDKGNHLMGKRGCVKICRQGYGEISEGEGLDDEGGMVTAPTRGGELKRRLALTIRVLCGVTGGNLLNGGRQKQ